MAKPRHLPPALALPGDRVDAWRVERQLVATGSGAMTPEVVAEALIGVQAQVVSSANLSIALRTSGAGGVEAAAEALKQRRLVRTWAMRGTLHAFSASDFPTIAASLKYRETWRSPVWLRYFKVTEPEMEAVIAGIGDILGDGEPRSRAELAAELGDRLGPAIGEQLGSSWGTFLKPAATAGVLVQAATDGPNVAYVRPDRYLNAWRVEDPDAAIVQVFRRFLAAYGPASSPEILRWWGLQQPYKVRPFIEALQPELTEVDVDGERGLVLTRDVPAIQATSPSTGTVQLLGAFDPFIVGAGLRERLIPKAHLKRVSRTAGWISPVVLVDGRVGGVWTSTQQGRRLELTVDTFTKPSPVVRRGIDAAAERIGQAMGAGVNLTFGKVFHRARRVIRLLIAGAATRL